MGVNNNAYLIVGCLIDIERLKDLVDNYNEENGTNEYYENDDIIKKLFNKDLYLIFSGDDYSGELECYLTLTNKNNLSIDEINKLLSDKQLLDDFKEISDELDGSGIISITSSLRTS